MAASLRPSSGFSIFGHIRPGESVNVMRSFRLWHCCDLVTAGSSPTLATRRLSSMFISVDFPALGMHMIIMRNGLWVLSRYGASGWHSLGTLAASLTLLQLRGTGLTPSFLL